MKDQDWFLFVLTFITGIAIGMYVYVAAFKPTYAPEGISGGEVSASDFSIIGKAYGGSEGPESIRPSFRVLGDGSYMYIAGGSGENALVPINGNLPSGVIKELQKAVDESNLHNLSVPAIRHDCASDNDAFDYEYRITINNKQFNLDTCKTALSQNDSLAVALNNIWNTLSGKSVGKTYSGSLSKMAEEWLYDRLHSTGE